MATTKAQQKAVAKYMKNNYDEIKLRIPKGHRATVQAAADAAGESVNMYTQKAILARMGREDWPELPDQEDAPEEEGTQDE